MVINGDLPVCYEEGSSEESVIADSIPSGNILWAGSLSTIEGVDFRKGWENLFMTLIQERKALTQSPQRS